MRNSLVVFLLSFMLLFPLTGRAESLILVADSWCPYNCAEGSTAPGYLIEIATEALALSNFSVTYEEMNWTRAIHQVKTGKAHGLVGAVLAEVPDFVFPKHWLGIAPNAYFTLKGSLWKPTDKDAFSDIRLGVTRDYDYGGTLQPWIDTHKDTPLVQEAQGTNALQTNLQKLRYGRIDVLVDEKQAVLLRAKEMGMDQLIRFAGEDPLRPAEDRIYIAFSPADPRSPSYATALDKGLETLRKTGRLSAILHKYNIDDWEK
ncbi:MAG: substrate-binding periplasmic protein [Halodesulfovibrio sp.]